jgi:hypothetical protein
MKVERRITWAGVEFQPDLQAPKKLVRLGVVLFDQHSSGACSILICGRQPSLDSRPPEFKDVGSITMALATSWVKSMFKDALESDPQNLFQYLSQKWRWNLYLINPKRVSSIRERESVEKIGIAIYEKFVGESFKPASVSRMPQGRRVPTPGMVPPAWLIREFKSLSATAYQ